MSEIISLAMFLVQAVPVLFALGEKLGASDGKPAFSRHLLRHASQITDRKILQQALDQLGFRYQAGDPHGLWGAPIEFQILDEAGKPWVALARDDATETYMIYHNDPTISQEDIADQLRLSEQEPMAAIGRLSQQYGYLKTLHTLLEQGYKISKTVEVAPDGTQSLVLTRDDPKSKELHTIRLVLKSEDGQTIIMTDSQKADGSHGVCPNLDNILKSMGMEQFEKVMSPASPRQAKRGDHPVAKAKISSGSEYAAGDAVQTRKDSGK